MWSPAGARVVGAALLESQSYQCYAYENPPPSNDMTVHALLKRRLARALSPMKAMAAAQEGSLRQGTLDKTFDATSPHLCRSAAATPRPPHDGYAPP